MNTRTVTVGHNTVFLDLIKKFNYDDYFIVYINGGFVEQNEIFELMLKYGSEFKIHLVKELSFP